MPEFFEQNPIDALSHAVDDYRIAGNPSEGEAPVDLKKVVRKAAYLYPG